MILPTDFLDTLETDTQKRFLEDLLVAESGADAYTGDLDHDRERLLREIRRGVVRVEFSEETESFRLLSREQMEARVSD